MNLSKLLRNDIFIFVFSKYLSFGLQFLISIVIASRLGLFYFGLYSFFKLVITYLGYSNLGINYSFNVEISSDTNKDIIRAHNYFRQSLIITFIIFLIFLALSTGVSFTKLDYFVKFDFYSYIFLLPFFGLCRNLNILYLNSNRLFGLYRRINISYFIPVLLESLLVVFFKGKILFDLIVYSALISEIVVLFFNFYKNPINFTRPIKFNFPYRDIVKRGIHLLLYNMSFYFILLSIRTLASNVLTVNDFAIFNFAYFVSIAISMLTGSLKFLFYPNLINQISKLKNSSLYEYVISIRDVYIFGLVLVVFLTLIVFKSVLIFIPEFVGSFQLVIYFLVAQIIYDSAYGVTTALVQRKFESYLTLVGFFVIIFCYIVFKLTVNFIADIEFRLIFSLLTGYIVYFLSSSFLFYKLIVKFNFFTSSLFMLIVFPIVLLLIIAFFSLNNYFLVFGFIAYLGANFTFFFKIRALLLRMINNPNLLNLFD